MRDNRTPHGFYRLKNGEFIHLGDFSWTGFSWSLVTGPIGQRVNGIPVIREIGRKDNPHQLFINNLFPGPKVFRNGKVGWMSKSGAFYPEEVVKKAVDKFVRDTSNISFGPPG